MTNEERYHEERREAFDRMTERLFLVAIIALPVIGLLGMWLL